MTACTNHGGKARRVVTAALVGVLSVGTVPMVALAEGVNDAVSPMFVEGGSNDGAAEFVNGTVKFEFSKLNADGTTADVTGSAYDDADGIKTIDADELPIIVSATSVTPAGSVGSVPVAPGNDFSIQVFHADEEGKPTGSPIAGNRVIDAGEYVIAITPLTGSDYLGQTFTARFNVKGVDLPTGLVAYEAQNAGDTEFIYTGSELDVNIKYPNPSGPALLLNEGVDYDVEWYKGSAKVDSVKDAGTYVGKLTGKGKYAGSEASVTVEVFAFNLASTFGTVTVTCDDFSGALPEVSVVSYDNGRTTLLDPSMVTLEPAGSVTGASETAYTFNVKPSAAAGSNVTGATTTTAFKLDKFASFTYGGKALADSYDLDESKGEKFDASDVKAYFGSAEQTVAVSAVKTGAALVDTTGADNSDKALNDLKNGEFGTYTVTFETTPDTIDRTVYGGSKTITVRVWKGFIDCDTDLYCYGTEWDSKVAITSYAKGYDAEDLKAGSFWVRNGDLTATINNGELQATLYDAEGNEVDSAVDAGEYTLVITSDTYKLTGSEGSNVLPITIGKVDLTSARIGKLLKWNYVTGQEFLPTIPTGYTLTPSQTAINELGLVYDSGNDGAAYRETGYNPDDWKGEERLPYYAVNVQVEYNDEGTWKPVAKIDATDSGEFRATLSVSDDLLSNFVLPEGENSVTLYFTVASNGKFSDVQPSDWYYDAVTDAEALKYMNGYEGTTTFGAEDNLTRAQAVIVLYNMSGSADKFDTEDSFDKVNGWVTGFSDVDGHAYYAQAVAWAKKTGVVNGYDATHFGPEDEITREQFAAMLSNYAKVVNRDETVGKVDESVLDEYADAGTVSDWARGAVAWAVENEVMGNNGSVMGQNKITRGEVAAMAVNYQPVNKAGIARPSATKE